MSSDNTLPLPPAPFPERLPGSPVEKLADPGVAGKLDGDVELERMVCVTGISSGAGLLPAGEDVAEDDGAAGESWLAAVELAGDDPSAPGGREPLPASVVVVPSGFDTFIAGFPFPTPFCSVP